LILILTFYSLPCLPQDIPDEQLKTHRESTTLDRVHAAMILQASGRANALRALLKAEQERGPEFLRLSNALTALYQKGSEERNSQAGACQKKGKKQIDNG